MKVQIQLQNGTTITADLKEYNAQKFADQINAPNVAVVSLGDYIFSKHLIAYVAPETGTEE